MPHINNGNEFPGWREIDFYRIINLNPGEVKSYKRKSLKEILFACEGNCSVRIDDQLKYLVQGEIINLNYKNEIIIESENSAVLIIVGGRWNDEIGSYGIFSLDNSSTPKNIGDPVQYERTTEFDNHFHDCDELWIIYSGSGLAVSENKFYNVKAGECIATKMGDHHDF